MRMAVSSTGQSKEDKVDMSFGRCKYFQIYDTEDDRFYTLKNNGEIASGGAGVKAAQQLIDEKIEVIITGSLGPNAYLIIKKSDIIVYKAEEGSVVSMIGKYNKGVLCQIDQAGAERKKRT